MKVRSFVALPGVLWSSSSFLGLVRGFRSVVSFLSPSSYTLLLEGVQAGSRTFSDVFSHGLA